MRLFRCRRFSDNTDVQPSRHMGLVSRHNSNFTQSNGEVSLALEWSWRLASRWQFPTSAADWQQESFPTLGFVTFYIVGKTFKSPARRGRKFQRGRPTRMVLPLTRWKKCANCINNRIKHVRKTIYSAADADTEDVLHEYLSICLCPTPNKSLLRVHGRVMIYIALKYVFMFLCCNIF